MHLLQAQSGHGKRGFASALLLMIAKGEYHQFARTASNEDCLAAGRAHHNCSTGEHENVCRVMRVAAGGAESWGGGVRGGGGGGGGRIQA